MLSLLDQEIHSQPDVLARLLERETEHVAQIVAQLPPFEYALIAARGSSDHTALYAKYALATFANYPVALAAPSLHTLYGARPTLAHALVVGVSQSGQSPDIVAVLAEGKRQGRPTLAITNEGNSPLAAIADYVVELHAGVERSIAATKTYTAQLVALMLLAASLSGNTEHMAELRCLPDAVAATLQASNGIAEQAQHYRTMEQCVVIGRGYNYATASELALKLKELTYVTATSYSSADFRHGPIATIDTGFPTLLIMPKGVPFTDMLALASELRQRGAELLIVSDAPQALTMAKTAFPLASPVSEWLSPVTAIIPGQLLALHLAVAKGLNPDVPRGLQKVTKTL